MTQILKMPAPDQSPIVSNVTPPVDPFSMPLAIAGAVVQVSGTLSAVARSAFNEHGKYKFASTDDVYAATNRAMAEAGLIVMPLVVHHEVVRIPAPLKERGTILRDADKNVIMSEVAWLRETYQYVLSVGDESWTHAHLIEPIFVQINGPQTFQAARSYAMKSFLRSLLKIPTGDYDLDQTPQEPAAPKARSRKSSNQAKLDGDWILWESRLSQLKSCRDRMQASDWYESYRDEIEAAPAKWADIINAEFDAFVEGLTSQP